MSPQSSKQVSEDYFRNLVRLSNKTVFLKSLFKLLG